MQNLNQVNLKICITSTWRHKKVMSFVFRYNEQAEIGVDFVVWLDLLNSHPSDLGLALDLKVKAWDVSVTCKRQIKPTLVWGFSGHLGNRWPCCGFSFSQNKAEWRTLIQAYVIPQAQLSNKKCDMWRKKMLEFPWKPKLCIFFSANIAMYGSVQRKK